jgi:hypothetical protein
MKIRFLLALLGLAISFALPTFAQEKEEANAFPFRPVLAGPQLVQQVEAINLKFDEAFNKHDVAAVGALYTAKRGSSDASAVVFRSRGHLVQ